MPNAFLSAGRARKEQVVVNLEDELHRMLMEE